MIWSIGAASVVMMSKMAKDSWKSSEREAVEA
jgi:hypothetical protein